MYKIVTNEEYLRSYALTHPDARRSPNGLEVVLSDEGDMTAEEVRSHISSNWITEESL